MPAPRLLLLALVGAALGLAAAATQPAFLVWGGLTAFQLALFALFCAVAGALLCAAGAWLAGRAWVGVLLATLAAAVFVPWNARERPHVYLLVTDTTRADHLSLYGYARETTPFLEELAEQSLIFTNAVSQGSHTIVSTPSILTSRYPSEHGLRDYDDVLSPRFTLLSEALAARGYRTFGYATNPHLGRRNGFAQGFDVYLEYRGNWRKKPHAEEVNQRLLRWLDRPGAGAGPIFAFLFYLDPHNPYAPPGDWTRRFGTRWRGPPVTSWNRKEWGTAEPGDPRLASLVASYDGALAYWDAQLRELVAQLEARGLFENALLVYTSDHGEEFFEHGHWGHNRTLYEESIRVPFLLSIPVPLRFPPLPRVAGVEDAVVSGVDVLPTVLDVLGLAPERDARGRSILPVALGRDDGADRYAYHEEILERYGPYDLRGIRTRNRKLVRVFDYEGDRTRRDLLFDLRADPYEQRNLAESGADGAGSLAERLAAHLAEMEAFAAPARAKSKVSDEELERLRMLGYVGDRS